MSQPENRMDERIARDAKAEWIEPRIEAVTMTDETRGNGGGGIDFGSEVSGTPPP